MKNIKEINTLAISRMINVIREYFLSKGFVEYTLPLLTKYEITNSTQIKITEDSFLRNTTEPEIWHIGSGNDKFFCITSLFRKEDPNSNFHKEEFKILDFYLNNSSQSELIDLLYDLVRFIESKLDLPKLSNLKANNIDFYEFENIMNLKSNTIFNVINYPIEESFFDETVSSDLNRTHKGELFFIRDSTPIEFCVYGKVGENKNPETNIIGFDYNTANYDFNNLYGMCIGIERILMIYDYLKTKI